MWATRLATVLLLLTFVLGGCGESAQPAGASSDIIALGRLVQLPKNVESAEWVTREMPGGNDWQLVARLTVPTSVTDDLMASQAPNTWQGGDLAEFEWLGEDANLTATTQCYNASQFFKAPLLQGDVVVLRDGVLLLVMHTQ